MLLLKTSPHEAALLRKRHSVICKNAAVLVRRIEVDGIELDIDAAGAINGLARIVDDSQL